jgi:hypothetical protein
MRSPLNALPRFLRTTKSSMICRGRFSNRIWWFTPPVTVPGSPGVSDTISVKRGRCKTGWNTLTWVAPSLSFSSSSWISRFRTSPGTGKMEDLEEAIRVILSSMSSSSLEALNVLLRPWKCHNAIPARYLMTSAIHLTESFKPHFYTPITKPEEKRGLISGPLTPIFVEWLRGPNGTLFRPGIPEPARQCWRRSRLTIF